MSFCVQNQNFIYNIFSIQELMLGIKISHQNNISKKQIIFAYLYSFSIILSYIFIEIVIKSERIIITIKIKTNVSKTFIVL